MSHTPAPRPFSGVSAVTVTPFGADGSSLDEQGIATLVDAVVGDGVDVVVPCGNTGEFYTLSEAEARRVVEITTEAAGSRAPVVVGVGHAVDDAVRATRHAAARGAAAVMVHHPSHPYLTVDGLLAYYDRVARAADIPIIPYVKSGALGEDGLLRLVERPEVVAVKYAVNDLPAFAGIVARARDAADVTWICGTAELWAPFFWAAGAEGFTSGLANVTARHSVELLEALRARDRGRAMAVWARVRPFELLRARAFDGYNVSVVKEAMRLVGRPAGPVRPPSSPVTPADAESIAALVAAWGS